MIIAENFQALTYAVEKLVITEDVEEFLAVVEHLLDIRLEQRFDVRLRRAINRMSLVVQSRLLG